MKPLDIGRIRRAFPGRRIDYYPVVDSTMRALSECDPGAVALAEEQTAGLGRHGHAWHSEPYAGIYCSVALRTAPMLTLALGLAAQRAIEEATGLACDLRWPNDLMLGGRKTGGILVQASGGRATAGVGINVHHRAFPAELEGEATSLALEAGPEKEPSREAIVLALLPAIDWFTALPAADIPGLFARRSSYAAGRRVTVHQPEGLIEGTTAGVDASGFLVVRKDDGTDTLILAGGVRAARS